ncbi:cytosolic sulfotransferase 5 [Amborella trichopoda]|uniref:cytosolic sulfotransferase 5 n=1 Tax=Amborella trichopoda TaxID=13333 RepID=UPI0009BE1463|nr:cytosolic sulfotransferase 5 [Amborella trichopoda]|eukprot:XP_020530842.1 cytosolic sulfotransferase 5 [Amborella trichopoda]
MAVSSLSQDLPATKLFSGIVMYQWQGYWYPPSHLEAAMDVSKHFVAHPDDILLAAAPKTGTTWLSALLFSIASHGLIPKEEIQKTTKLPLPRLFSTHIPYSTLPEPLKDSGSRIIYISRNPRDAFVSLWHFSQKIQRGNSDPLTFEEAFEQFCEGKTAFGPFLEHVLEYWKASQERTQNILFLTYEEMKADTKGGVKRMAQFLGRSIETEEEVEEIVDMCSFERLSNLEVNTSKEKSPWAFFPYNSFFRKGVVGDWVNYFTPAMTERLDRIIQAKIQGSGLQFRFE